MMLNIEDDTLEAAKTDSVATIWDALDDVKDPCHVLSGHDLSILDLGLVNRVEVADRAAVVAITLTEVSCTLGYRIIEDIEALAGALDGIDAIRVAIEPFPVWTPDRMSARGREHHARTRRAFLAEQRSAIAADQRQGEPL